MNFNFGEVLARAWQVIWKHKVLWIFGILAGCARGGGGGGGGGGNRSYQTGPNGDFPFDERAFDQIGQWFSDNLWIVVAIIIALFLISIFFYFIAFIGKIGLIKGTQKVETGAQVLNFGELFSESTPYFWRVVGLNFLVGLAFLAILISFALLGIITAGIGFLCLIPLVCVLIPVSWAAVVVLEQANAAIVIENLSMFEGLKRGWEVSKANFGPIIIMALILLFGGGIVSVIIALPIFLAIIPIIPSLVTGDFQASSLWVAGLCFVAFLPVLIVLNGILSAYIQSAWTLTFMRLTAPQQNTPVFIEANA
ncbi:MAG: hypothetical protein HZB19_11300 [Chloroflexi bacterium]|nr:hypothetical protein [Chloroflexota bacterium]